MAHEVAVFLFTLSLFLGMLLFLEIGRRSSIRRMKEDAGAAGEGVGAVDGAVFALLVCLSLLPSLARVPGLTRGGS